MIDGGALLSHPIPEQNQTFLLNIQRARGSAAKQCCKKMFPDRARSKTGHNIRGAQMKLIDQTHRIVEYVTVGSHGAFGVARGSRRVTKISHRLRRDLDSRVRWRRISAKRSQAHDTTF